ncbi:unnamed protein product [Cladocopium goreaui]|uniref:Uncharacterized protein n=1 Tax=Cladocopium goreaui TaxID=2562237 RepID=A0A9P1D8M1_9DINO|nr:unnamed protein product [Cladocopium goreaui]
MDASASWFPLVALALMSMPKLGKLDRKKRVRKVAVKQKSISRSRVPVLGHADASGQQLDCQPSRPTHAINGDSVYVSSFTSGLNQRFYLACHRKVADFFRWSPIPRSLESFECRVVGYYTTLIDEFLKTDSEINGGEAARLWPTFLLLSYPLFQTLTLSRMLLSLALRGVRNQMMRTSDDFPHHDFCEVFAGCGNLTRECLRLGLSGCAFDWVFEPEEHNLCGKGIRLVLDCIASIRQSGLLWIACECRSFTVLCRAQSARSQINNFIGDDSRGFVQVGNILQAVSSLFYFIGWLLQIHVVLEQPQSSCLQFCRPVLGVFHYTGTMSFRTYLGSFGGETVKPLSLFTTWRQIEELQCEKPRCDSTLTTRDDSGAFTGRKDELYKSQQYTVAFGRRVGQLLQAELFQN